MITAQKYQTISKKNKSSDWKFVPILLSASLGVSIGLLVGYSWGWL